MKTQYDNLAAVDPLWSRAQGSVFGAFIGDAAGSYVEFMRKSNISAGMVKQAMALGGGGPFRLGPGQITDDSEMAMGILHGLVPNSEVIRGSPQDVKVSAPLPLDIAGIQMFFNRWVNSPPFDIGNTTRQALDIISNPKAGIKKENFRP